MYTSQSQDSWGLLPWAQLSLKPKSRDGVGLLRGRADCRAQEEIEATAGHKAWIATWPSPSWEREHTQFTGTMKFTNE